MFSIRFLSEASLLPSSRYAFILFAKRLGDSLSTSAVIASSWLKMASFWREMASYWLKMANSALAKDGELSLG
jgi:hypothetical protein